MNAHQRRMFGRTKAGKRKATMKELQDSIEMMQDRSCQLINNLFRGYSDLSKDEVAEEVAFLDLEIKNNQRILALLPARWEAEDLASELDQVALKPAAVSKGGRL